MGTALVEMAGGLTNKDHALVWGLETFMDGICSGGDKFYEVMREEDSMDIM